MEAHQILESKLQPLKMYLEKNSITEIELDKIKPILQDVIILSTLMYRQRIDRFQRVTVNNWIEDVDGRVEYIKHLKNPPKECVKKYTIPMIFNFPAGHIHDNRALILGNNITIDVTENCSTVVFE